MNSTMRRRVAALEQRQPSEPVGCVYESEQAARAAGATGGVLLIPAALPTDEWCAAAKAQQAELTRGTHDAKP